MKIAVIGSGLSGLTAAAHLARAGHQVAVFEQYPQIGGVTAPYERDGYRWDLGQLVVEGMGPGEPLGRVLAELGIADKVPVRVEDRGYVFPDFRLDKPLEYQGIRWRINRLKEIFPEDANGLECYWADYLRFTSVMTLARRMEAAKGLEVQYWKIRLYLKVLPLLRKQNWDAQRLVDDYFSSEKLKLVFTSILADFFTPPREFQGLGVFVLNPEASFDKRMPREIARDAEQLYYYSILGGIGRLVDALVGEIELHRGVIHTNRPISRILVEDGHAAGVVDSSGETFRADAVIASGGAKETFLRLVGQGSLPPDFVEKVSGIPLMDSVFMVHLGVDFDPSPHVHGVCTYYYGTYDLDRAITEGKNGIYHEGRDGFVIHIPSLHSPKMAPAGHHAMTIYTICPDRLREGSWEERKEEFADKLIACAEEHIPGLSQHVRICEILTADDFRQRTHLDHHAFGGIKPVLGSWRVPHRTPVQGLWFVGAQSESGGGVNAVMPAALKTARQVAESAPD